jgi:hypothetical protein
MHPDFPSVAELFPSYDDCRGQYSRSFHKYKRVLSLPPELQRTVQKRKLVPNTSNVYADDDINDIHDAVGQHNRVYKRAKGMRRGREADELFQKYVPAGYKREMAPGYVAIDKVSIESLQR